MSLPEGDREVFLIFNSQINITHDICWQVITQSPIQTPIFILHLSVSGIDCLQPRTQKRTYKVQVSLLAAPPLQQNKPLFTTCIMSINTRAFLRGVFTYTTSTDNVRAHVILIKPNWPLKRSFLLLPRYLFAGKRIRRGEQRMTTENDNRGKGERGERDRARAIAKEGWTRKKSEFDESLTSGRNAVASLMKTSHTFRFGSSDINKRKPAQHTQSTGDWMSIFFP